jgi:hypothetical protein
MSCYVIQTEKCFPFLDQIDIILFDNETELVANNSKKVERWEEVGYSTAYFISNENVSDIAPQKSHLRF